MNPTGKNGADKVQNGANDNIINANVNVEPVQEEIPPKKGEGRSVLQQLDVLLVKAAKASTKGVDEKQVKEAFQKLVDDGVLSEASIRLLEQAAGKATTTLKALNKFTGQQLATAFNKKGSLDASSKVGKVIKAAVDKSLIPLAKKIEAFRKNPSNAIDSQELAELQSEVNTGR